MARFLVFQKSIVLRLSRVKSFLMSKSIFLFSLLLISSCMSTAQEISSHKWENRVLIVLTEDSGNPLLKKQIEELEKHTAGLSERKLIVYISTPQKFKKGLDSESWETSAKFTVNSKTRNLILKLFWLDWMAE